MDNERKWELAEVYMKSIGVGIRVNESYYNRTKTEYIEKGENKMNETIRVIDPSEEFKANAYDPLQLLQDVENYLAEDNKPKETKYCQVCNDRVNATLNQLSELYDKVGAKSLQEMLIATQEYNKVLEAKEE